MRFCAILSDQSRLKYITVHICLYIYIYIVIYIYNTLMMMMVMMMTMMMTRTRRRRRRILLILMINTYDNDLYQRHWDLLSQTVIIGFIGSDKNTSTAEKHHDVDIMLISNHWIFNDTHVVGHRLLHGRGRKCFFLLFERIWRDRVRRGMLTFLVHCTHVRRYATEGLGSGGAC